MDQLKIGKFIAKRRKSQGLTQARLAEQLGITDRAVSKWETGRSFYCLSEWDLWHLWSVVCFRSGSNRLPDITNAKSADTDMSRLTSM